MKTLTILFSLVIMMNSSVIVDFNSQSDLSGWQVVNDGVMGGKSRSTFQLNEAGNAVFSGDVSLKNFGGFASVRYQFENFQIEDSDTAVLHLKGDGKRYQFRVKSNSRDRHSYIAYFETNKEWQQIKIPLREMYASFRGQRLNMPTFDAEKMAEMSFLIGNGEEELFELMIAKIVLK